MLESTPPGEIRPYWNIGAQTFLDGVQKQPLEFIH